MDHDLEPVERVRRFLRPLGIEVVELPDDTSTAVLAAQALRTTVATIVKSLLFLIDEEPYLVLVSGNRKIDKRKLARDVGGRKARLADPDRALSVTGYAVGGVPPVALRTRVPVLMDRHLLAHPVVYAAAGSSFAVFPVEPDRLRDVTEARVIQAVE